MLLPTKFRQRWRRRVLICVPFKLSKFTNSADITYDETFYCIPMTSIENFM